MPTSTGADRRSAAGDWLDRAIGYFSPAAELKRRRMRLAVEAVRAYQGANVGRQGRGWNPLGTSGNAEMLRDAGRLRDRSRDLTRNQPWGSVAVQRWTANLVGTGILPKAKDKGQNELFAEWAPYANADGQGDFYGTQAVAVRCLVESGSVLIRHRLRRPEDGLPVPIQFQVIEPDFLDRGRTQASRPQNSLSMGIEFDPIGRRAGYWLFRDHPGNSGGIRPLVSTESVFVPAAFVEHLFVPLRAGDIDGVPWGSPSMTTLKDGGDYDEATLMRKLIEACVVAFIEQPDSAIGLPLGKPEIQANGQVYEKMEPGQFIYGRQGEKVSFNSPAAPSGYGEYARYNAMKGAAGYGLTYEQFTGDLSQVNFSSMRAGLNEFRRACEMIQWTVIIPAFARLYRAWAEAARLAGVLRKPELSVAWAPPRWAYVNPVDDVAAIKEQVRAGLMSLSEAIRQMGYDPDEVFAEIAAERKKLAALGVEVDVITAAFGAMSGGKPNLKAVNS